uniref:Cyclin-like domain-containing protein n=1 Tax=Chinchilla lanigera TaxID=34839 RepID=A0A8C2YJY1_CHILA
MTEVLNTTDSQKLLHQLNTLLEQEARCQPKVCRLRLIESARDNGLRMTAGRRDFEVKDLLSLTQFFGFDTETFSLAVNLLDRFLSTMKVQPKHLGCVGLSCFYLAIKSIEEERNVPLNGKDCIGEGVLESQSYNSCYSRIQENLPFERKNSLNFERLEAQLKPPVLALSIIALEIQAQKCVELTEGVECLQKHSKTNGRDLTFCVSLNIPQTSVPNVQKVKWTVAGCTARQLKHSYYRITHLPTSPETVP